LESSQPNPSEPKPESGKAEETSDTRERKAKLGKCIKDNPHSSTIEREQLREIEEQERKERSMSGEVLF
jgi:hypothetical protein